MILVDSSVWIDHLRSGEPALIQLLNSGQVLGHPFVTGELACGNLKNRQEILSLMQDLPTAHVADDVDVLAFIEKFSLMGKGIGYVDAHLLATVFLAHSARLWSRDKRLAIVAEELRLSFDAK